ncbi:unannotated protein [freshwater metagenome]|uniref:Unannotated protein n=1 Tax=freshwater metagenome TaxID=449393 RepID=A0A6J7IPF9_9ZZZZ
MSPLVVVESLVKEFPSSEGAARRAVDEVSFSVDEREIFGIVGESGSGKTTVARVLLHLTRPTSGRVTVAGIDPWNSTREERRRYHEVIQVVFQDPYSSMDPRMRVGAVVSEGLRSRRTHDRPVPTVTELLDLVGLPASYAGLYPHELSGGQRQRAAIARALAMGPQVLVADEPVSALDVSMRGQVLNLLTSLQVELGLTVIFISHDLGIVQQMCNRVAVMHLGRVVEMGNPVETFEHPTNSYTQQLVASVPRVPTS